MTGAEAVGFDAVFAVAELIGNEETAVCRTMEDLCVWYKKLAPHAYQRPIEFWKLFSSKDFSRRLRQSLKKCHLPQEDFMYVLFPGDTCGMVMTPS